MRVQDKMHILLEQNRDTTISGEEAAAKLGVSRAAVNKAVQALRGQGLQVQAVPGKGYRLEPDCDLLSLESVVSYMGAQAYPVQVLQEAASTNTVAKQWAMEGAAHGSMVVAVRQKGGRGRMGRYFASPAGGIYMSIVLRPSQTQSSPVLITSATAVEVCRCIEEQCGFSLGIKWVNDLFYNGLKCCGILSEAGSNFESGGIDYIVVGIGLNYRTLQEQLDEEMQSMAISLYPDGNAPLPRAAVIADIHKRILKAFESLDKKEFLQEYRSRSIVLGKQVQVMAAQPYFATVAAIDEQAQLLLRLEDGTQKVLGAGEISIKV